MTKAKQPSKSANKFFVLLAITYFTIGVECKSKAKGKP